MSTFSSSPSRNEPRGALRRWLWRRANLFVVIPSWPGIGNSAEEVYFALLLAEQLDKRVLIIFPIQLPWPLHLPLLKVGALDICAPQLICRPGGLAVLPVRIAVSIYFGVGRLAQKLLKRIGIRVPDRFAIPRFGQESLWCPAGWAQEFDWQALRSIGWDEAIDFAPTVRLPGRTRRVGERALTRLGIGSKDWFVCLHVRDGGFYGDPEISAPRNGTLAAFERAIQLVASQGGKVVRLGSEDMAPAPKIPGLIDYATSGLAQPRIDAFLLSRCRFYIGMQSGPYDLAPIFGKPRLVANMYNALIGLPFRNGDAGFFKRMASGTKEIDWMDILTSKRVVLEELGPQGIEALKRWAGDGPPEYTFRPDWSLCGIEYEERSADEVAAFVQEFIDFCAAGEEIPYGTGMPPGMLEAIRGFISENQFSQDPEADIQAKYRFASRITPYLDRSISR